MSSLLLAAAMAVPKVDHHDQAMSLSQVQSVCEKRLEEDELPCAVVQIGDEVCWAFMDLDGESETVQCYIRMNESYAGDAK